MALRIIFDYEGRPDEIDFQVVNSKGEVIGNITNATMNYDMDAPAFIQTLGSPELIPVIRNNDRGNLSLTIGVTLYPTAFINDNSKPERKLIKYTVEKAEEIIEPTNYALRQRRLSEEA